MKKQLATRGIILMLIKIGIEMAMYGPGKYLHMKVYTRKTIINKA